MAKSALWSQALPPVEAATPVLAVATDADQLWVGGVGGIAQIGQDGTESLLDPGPLTSVAALFVAEGTVFAGGAEGVARWHGQSWQRADVRSGGSPVVAFARCGTTLLAATLGDGVLRSDDGGYTWTPANFGLAGTEVSALVTGPNGMVLAGTDAGICLSDNAGRAWRPCPCTETAIAALARCPDGTVVAATEDGGTLHSADGAHAWAHGGPAPRDAAAMLCTVGGLLLGTTGRGLWRSVDQGQTWQQVDAAVLGTVYALAATPNRIYAGTDHGLAVSQDTAATWRPLPSPPTHDLDRLLLLRERPLVVGSRSGCYMLTTASRWEPLPATPLPITTAAVTPEQTLLVSSPSGLWRWTDCDWAQALTDDVGHIGQMTFRRDGIGWATPARHGHHLLRTDDGGLTWNVLPAPFGVHAPVALQAFDDTVLAATFDPRRGVARLWSSGDGTGWRQESYADTGWPVVATLQQPAAVSLGGVVFRRDGPRGWARWHRFDGGIRTIAWDGCCLIALTVDGLWTGTAGEGVRPLELGAAPEWVLDVCATESSLIALHPRGKVTCVPSPACGHQPHTSPEKGLAQC